MEGADNGLEPVFELLSQCLENISAAKATSFRTRNRQTPTSTQRFSAKPLKQSNVESGIVREKLSQSSTLKPDVNVGQESGNSHQARGSISMAGDSNTSTNDAAPDQLRVENTRPENATFSTFLMTPDEIATKAAKEFAKAVDAWEQNGRKKPCPERFAVFLTDKYLCKLLDPLPKSILVTTVRKAIISEVDRISKLPPLVPESHAPMLNPEPDTQLAQSMTDTYDRSRDELPSNVTESRAGRVKAPAKSFTKPLRGPANRTRSRAFQHAGMSMMMEHGSAPMHRLMSNTPEAREEVANMQKRFMDLKFNKPTKTRNMLQNKYAVQVKHKREESKLGNFNPSQNKNVVESAFETNQSFSNSAAEQPHSVSVSTSIDGNEVTRPQSKESRAEYENSHGTNQVSEGLGFEALLEKVEAQDSRLRAIKLREQGTIEMRIIAKEQQKFSDQFNL